MHNINGKEVSEEAMDKFVQVVAIGFAVVVIIALIGA
jgi:hypothetical protein